MVEDGTVTLVGATTENPSFALNGALLSRCQVMVLKRLDDAALDLLLTRAEEETGRPLPLQPEARGTLRAMADGDGRYLLNMAEQLFALPERTQAARHRRAVRRCWRSAPRSTTRTARSTTTSSPRCTNRCAARTPTRRCTGSRAC